MMGSPAGPDLNLREWQIMDELCRLNINTETAVIRQKIRAYFAARKLAATQDEALKGEA